MSAPNAHSSSADHNLLCGILALQMNFVDRDALIAAMHAWVLDKAKPLGQILVEQGKLSPERRVKLEDIVEESLRAHQGDAKQSLAVLALNSAEEPGTADPAGSPVQRSPWASVWSEVHAQLLGLGDADVSISLTTVAARTRTDPYATVSPIASPDTDKPCQTRFEHIRTLDEGGMGVVYVALDRDLGREVALKEIRGKQADDAQSRARFLLEGEVTGKLEHPGVVPVYGMGSYQDGRPFYAMRLIRGETFDEAITRFHRAELPGRDMSERSLAFRQLLGHFVAVCNALAYAHSRGIIHRDIKPTNVRLGKFGETVVLDWGLAKVVGRPDSARGLEEGTLRPSSGNAVHPTQLGDAAGTPVYMSPEQAAGQWDQVGPASDIYSLGATLYTLLTGSFPDEGSDMWIRRQRRVRTGEFVRPRERKKNVPLALEAICLKAMALQPDDRYATAKALADDVEHWLADERVAAYREPWRIRAGRWARRHKPVVSAISASLLVMLLLGGVVAWRLEWQAAERRQFVESDLRELERLQEQDKWDKAAAVLNQAKARLGEGGPVDLRQLLDQATRDLALVKRLESIRLQRLNIDFYTGLSQTYTSDADYELAFQQAELGKPGDDTKTIADLICSSRARGRLTVALDDWSLFAADEARRGWILQVARRVDPDPWRDQIRDLALHNKKTAIGELIDNAPFEKWSADFLGTLSRWLEEDRRDRVLYAALDRHPDHFWIHWSVAVGKISQNAWKEAVESYRAALALRPDITSLRQGLSNVLLNAHRFEEAEKEIRHVLAARPESAAAHALLGHILKRRGQLSEAIKAFKQAIRLNDKKADYHCYLASALDDLNRLKEAEDRCQLAVKIDPKCSLAHLLLGVLREKEARHSEAESEYRRALCLLPKLEKLNASSHAEIHTNLSGALRMQGKFERAVNEAKEAITCDPTYALGYVELCVALLEHADLPGALAASRKAIVLAPNNGKAHSALGNSLYKRKDFLCAMAEYEKALDLNPEDVHSHNSLGNCFRAEKQLKKAIDEYNTAIKLDPSYILGYYNLGSALYERKDYTEAIQAFGKAIALDRKHALAHAGLGECLKAQKNLPGAIAAYKAALLIDHKLTLVHCALADALSKNNQFPDAIQAYRNALTLDPNNAVIHCNLGNALKASNDHSGAIVEYNKAISNDPNNALAHLNLAIALIEQKEFSRAVTESEKAIEIEPANAKNYYALGNALNARKETIGRAIEAYKRSIALGLKDAGVHNNLGNALKAQKNLPEAIAEYRNAVQLNPGDSLARWNLGLALQAQGNFAEACVSVQKSIDLLPKNDIQRFGRGLLVTKCKRLEALDARLPAILRGEAFADKGERLEIARLCLQYRRLYNLAARLYGDALEADQRLAEKPTNGFRYSAACSAALAGWGQGEDAEKLKEPERLRLREQARRWLQADLTLQRKKLNGGSVQDQAAVRQALQLWIEDANLAEVRGGQALARMPIEERELWKQLWADVDALLAMDAGKKP